MLGITPCRSCTFRKTDGKACRATPMREQEFCFLHHPDHKAEAAEARRLGGPRRRREKTLEGAYDLEEGFDTVKGIRRFVEIAALDLLGMEVSIGRANAILRAALVAAKLLEVGELEERLRNLESTLASRGTEMASPFDTKFAAPENAKKAPAA